MAWIMDQIPRHVTSVDSCVIEKVNFCADLDKFLFRDTAPGHTFTAFMIASQFELDHYLHWMKNR
eukprot:5163203-Pyramimonas_sp.AAC.1